VACFSPGPQGLSPVLSTSRWSRGVAPKRVPVKHRLVEVSAGAGDRCRSLAPSQCRVDRSSRSDSRLISAVTCKGSTPAAAGAVQPQVPCAGSGPMAGNVRIRDPNYSQTDTIGKHSTFIADGFDVMSNHLRFLSLRILRLKVMRSKLLNVDPPVADAVILDTGDEVVGSLFVIMR
jgi:hypothetical protein